MKTYVFSIDIEPDEDGFRAFYAPWEHLGASTWGHTEEEARGNIEEVLSMILEEFEEEGAEVPLAAGMEMSEGAAVAVTR